MRADFYLIAKPRFLDQPLLLVCELARKAIESNQWMLILVRDQAQAEELDELLWAFDDDAYIPHQIAGDLEDESTPILIVTPEFDIPARALTLNLRDTPYQGKTQRILEVVPADPEARAPLRERWTHYKNQGFTVNKYDM